MITNINFTLKANTREGIRREVIETFLDEHPGTGTGDDSSKYNYIVESTKGYKIVLKRPATLNKGLDFTVNIDGMFFKKNKRYSSPSHIDIINVLKQIRELDDYENVRRAISLLFECKNFDFKTVQGINFKDYNHVDRPIEIILLTVKWLFIEQDVTYWNWSGRNMLMKKLKEEGLIY